MTKRKKLTPIQASARGEDCTFRLEGCRNDTETTVLCHDTRHVDPNSPRKCDARAAYGCMHCHDIMDGRTYHTMGRNLKPNNYWLNAVYRTHVRLMQKGLLTFEGVVPNPKILPRRGSK